MLMVTRESGEVLRLVMGGETVEIRIVRIGERKVRLGIEAPESVKVIHPAEGEMREREFT